MSAFVTVTAKIIEERVNALSLPPKIKDLLIAELLDAMPNEEQLDTIIARVMDGYVNAGIEPCEPVGVVAAQSIGEPGTQMSLPADEGVLVDLGSGMEVVKIGTLVDDLIEQFGGTEVNGSEVCIPGATERNGAVLRVPSLNGSGKIVWKRVLECSRHRNDGKLLELTTRSGRKIRATPHHSYVIRENGIIKPIAGSKLQQGDRIPVARNIPESPTAQTCTALDLSEYLPKDEYWFGSELEKAACGDPYTVPVACVQLENHLNGNVSFELEEGFVYPVQNHGNARIPEFAPLDSLFGWFIGAYLAEGSTAPNYTAISNMDCCYQELVREFAGSWNLTFNEYDNFRGFAPGHDIRINSTLLQRFLVTVCGKGSHNKKVPDFAYGAPDEFIGSLLRGYFDGDGNVSTERKVIHISSCSHELIDGIALLLGRLGILATKNSSDREHILSIPFRYAQLFREKVGFGLQKKMAALDTLCASSEEQEKPYDAIDMVAGFGTVLEDIATGLGIPRQIVHSATLRQYIGRRALQRFRDRCAIAADEKGVEIPVELAKLDAMIDEDVIWDEIVSIKHLDTPGEGEYVYDFSVDGLETFITSEGVVTHNTMRTFHYAGVAEINVTLGLPRLIEILDARKNPSTPVMTVYLTGGSSKKRAQEVAWSIQRTTIADLGEIATDRVNLTITVEIDERAMYERNLTLPDIIEPLEAKLKVPIDVSGYTLALRPKEDTLGSLVQLGRNLKKVLIKGIENIPRVVIQKDGSEYVLYTEGTALDSVLDIEGVDPTRTISNHPGEMCEVFGIEAARNSIMNEIMSTLREQGLEVNVKHIMLASDMMTCDGEVKQIGRHGLSGEKASILARAAFEVTVNHLIDAGMRGEVDELDGVTENVIVGQPIRLGTGDVNLIVKP